MNKGRNGPTRFFSIIGFIVLSTLSGVGLGWLLIALRMGVALKRNFPNALGACMPFLFGGGVIGFAVGLAIAMWVRQSGPATEERIVSRFVRRRDKLRIYFGAPLAVFFGLMILLFPHLERIAGTDVASYIALGIFMAILGLGMFLYDRISPGYIIPIGVVGWLLIVAAAVVIGFSSIH